MTLPARPAPPPRRLLLTPAFVMIVCALGLTILGITILFSASVSFEKRVKVNDAPATDAAPVLAPP
ncbi:MAG: hypothetical protein RLZZ15_117, partial [Verrucomicrobiota bacterium]